MTAAAPPAPFAPEAPADHGVDTRRHRTYCIVTYGCQMNDNDTEIMSGILAAKGMTRVKAEADADVVLVNTCVVRDGAEERAVARLLSMAPLKKANPGMIIGVAGCMAQKDGAVVLDRVPLADLVVGTRDLFKIGALIDEIARTGDRLVSTADVDKPVFLEAQPVQRRGSLKGLVTVMYGCDNFCTFCIVPKTRGREVSRPLAEVVEECRRMAGEGFKEVQLLGQNVNSYWHDGRDFADLLAAVNDVPGLERIRFITSHPKDCGDKLIEACATLPKVCTNFHLPVQSGSDRVLRRMKRFYTGEQYLELVAKVRERVPGATISTDVIVGFPDETDEDFEATYDVLERARWDSAFCFMYSPREGTKAATWIDSIPLETKRHRLQRCIGRQEVISAEINAGYVGTVQSILVESVSKRRAEEMVGRTMGDKSIVFPGGEELIGRTVDVRVTESYAHTLLGVLE